MPRVIGTVTPRRSTRDEAGVIAVMTALTMVLVLVACAFVVDFGMIRTDRQVDHSAADAATVAGLHSLNAGNGQSLPYAGVCTALHVLANNDARFASLSDTAGSWTDGNGTPTSDGCTDPARATQTCTPGDTSTWARFTQTLTYKDEPLVVVIQSGFDLSAAGWAENSIPAVADDNSDGSAQGCDQLATILTQSRRASFGVLAGATDLTSGVHSVGRLVMSPPESPFALLLLERHDCDALANASGGAGGRIDVLGYQTNPGMIHVDSDGTGAMCSSKPVIEGKNPGTCPDPPPPATPTCGGIVAHEAPDTGAPGDITTVAVANASDGKPQVYAGPYPGTSPRHRDLITRSVVDVVYLQGVTDAVNNEARPAFAAAASGTPPAGYVSKPCPSAATTYTETKLFFNCSSINKNIDLPNATDVIFTGQIGTDLVTMPVAQHVYVAGNTTPNGTAIAVGTTFAMHDNGSSTCPTSYTPTATRARLFIQAGSLKTAGGSTFRACNTTVILMGNDSTGGACLPAPYDYTGPGPAPTTTPCPGGNAGNGLLSMGGNGTVEWTAPNLVDDNIKASDTDHHDLEDLALWDESYGVQTLGGGGYMHLAGVFSAPNATPFKLNGGPTQNVRDCQYVVRQLWTTGNGTLTMQPLPSLPVAPPTFSYVLVR